MLQAVKVNFTYVGKRVANIMKRGRVEEIEILLHHRHYVIHRDNETTDRSFQRSFTASLAVPVDARLKLNLSYAVVFDENALSWE